MLTFQFLNINIDIKMDVRDMSAFQSGSFVAVIDKGTSTFHRFSSITPSLAIYLSFFKNSVEIPTHYLFCNLCFGGSTILANHVLIFLVCFFRNFGLSSGEWFSSLSLDCFQSNMIATIMVKHLLQCGHNSRENAAKMLEEVDRYNCINIPLDIFTFVIYSFKLLLLLDLFTYWSSW